MKAVVEFSCNVNICPAQLVCKGKSPFANVGKVSSKVDGTSHSNKNQVLTVRGR